MSEQIGTESNQPNLWYARAAGLGLASVYIYISTLPIAMSILIGLTIFMLGFVISFIWQGVPGIVVTRWLYRTIGVMSGILMLAIIIGETSAGLVPGTPSSEFDIGFLVWIVLLIGIPITFLQFRWLQGEGIGGALVLLMALIEQTNVIFIAHGELNPYILIFVYVGITAISCWWRTRRLPKPTNEGDSR